jgi:AcrR family transcriptional regulator
MKKGEATRQTILAQATRLASLIGLESLSIGALAEQLALSKSGLFAHFRSKESLQKQVLDTAAQRFIDFVVKPAIREPRGEPRVRAIFENWLKWGSSGVLPGGCLFIAASAELDDKPGPVRDHLVKLQNDWRRARVRAMQGAIDQGHFRADADAEQLGHDLFSIMMGYHYAARLLGDPNAEAKARNAFERLIAGAKKL